MGAVPPPDLPAATIPPPHYRWNGSARDGSRRSLLPTPPPGSASSSSSPPISGTRTPATPTSKNCARSRLTSTARSTPLSVGPQRAGRPSPTSHYLHSAAGIHAKIGAHSLRATRSTEYLCDCGKPAVAQQMPLHRGYRVHARLERVFRIGRYNAASKAFQLSCGVPPSNDAATCCDRSKAHFPVLLFGLTSQISVSIISIQTLNMVQLILIIHTIWAKLKLLLSSTRKAAQARPQQS